MAYASVTIKDIVERSVNHKWSIPEFQRGFVWKATQVRDLIESLWLHYPVGTLLVWDSSGPVQPKSASDAQTPDLWVVDGQQRTTGLCILSGRKPYWWSDVSEWEKTIRKYDIRFDVHTKKEPFFVVANAATRRVKGSRYVPVSDLLNLDVSRDVDLKLLQEMAKRVKLDGLCDGMDAMEVYTRLDRVRKIRDADVVTITVDNELEDVVEIFSRLNSRGTRVTEADIYLGVVAARTPGWVRENFLPFVSQLSEVGYELSPNLVFRTLTGIGKKAVRYRSIDPTFWNAASIQPVWERTKKAWGLAIKRLKDHGILGNALLPADNALVSLIALLDKFPQDGFHPVLYWFLQASRFSRYSSSSTSSMEEDLKEIAEAGTLNEAVERLLAKIRYLPPLNSDEFMRDYADTRFGRLLLYLLVLRNEAVDWDQRGVRIGFDGAELLAGFQPQFHHIFPKKFLEGRVPLDSIDALANIAIIGPTINIRISKQDPMDYIPKYKITPKKLAQQFISGQIANMTIKQYPQWIQKRADELARRGNEFLEELRGDLNLPPVVVGSENQEHAFAAA
ncbi:MAG: DUF262 domain-containing protein [Roseiarcus sp.]